MSFPNVTNIIYNLLEYLTIELPTIAFVANSLTESSPKDCVLVMQTGGDVNHWYDRSDWRVQVLARNENSVDCFEEINNVYNLLKNRFQLLLPAITVDSIVYPAIRTYQISPIQAPAFIGADEKNLTMWSFNIVVTTE